MPDIIIPKKEVHIWKLSFKESEHDPEEFYLSSLSSDERQRADKLRFPEHRRRFLLARGNLRKLLGSYLDKEPQDIVIRYERFGKPYLSNESNHGNINFNLSHSGDYALYAITYGRQLGIDIEYIRPVDKALKIIERFFSDEEREYYENEPREKKIEAFFKLWCRREAYTKAIGRGFNLPASDICVSFVTGERRSLGDETPKSHTDLSIYDISADPGYAAALTVSGPQPRIIYRDVGINK